MAKQLTDEEVNLRRKLRRRLIGAAALTLTLVVTVPMVLDSEPKTTGEDIELRIPAPDKVGEFVPGKAAEESVDVPASAVSVSAVAAVSTVAEVAPVLPTSLPITRFAPAQPVVEKTPVAAPAKSAAPATPKAAAPVPAKPVLATPAKKPEPVKVSPQLAAPDNAANGFVAQVGAYSNADTARHELAQLKAWGFKAYTEKAGDKIRVRVGPYAEREKADKVRHLLEKHGLHPVVNPVK